MLEIKGRYGPQVWGGQAIEGALPIHMSVHEVTFACMWVHSMAN